MIGSGESGERYAKSNSRSLASRSVRLSHGGGDGNHLSSFTFCRTSATRLRTRRSAASGANDAISGTKFATRASPAPATGRQRAVHYGAVTTARHSGGRAFSVKEGGGLGGFLGGGFFGQGVLPSQ